MGTPALQQCATVSPVAINGGVSRVASCAHFTEASSDFQQATLTRTNGVWSGFWCKVLANTAPGTITCKIRATPLVSPVWVTGNQVLTIPTLTTGIFQDLTNTDVVTEPTFIHILTTVDIPDPGAASIQIFQILFTSDANERVYRLATQNLFVVDGFAGCQNFMLFNTGVAEVPLQMSVPAGTFRDLDVWIPLLNLTDDTTTLVLRVNGADSALTVVIPALTTGVFSDLVNQVTVVARDKVNWEARKPGTGSILFEHTAMDFVTPVFFGGGCVTAGVGIGFLTNQDRLCAHSGWHVPIVDEADIQAEALVTDIWEGIIVNIKTNGQATTVEWRGRSNGADNALLVVVPALTTGFFESTGGPVNVIPTDLINIRRLTFSVGGDSVLIYHVHNFFGVQLQPPPPPSGPPTPCPQPDGFSLVTPV